MAKTSSNKRAPQNKIASSIFVAGFILCLVLGGGVIAYQYHTHKVARIQKEQDLLQLKVEKEREERKAKIQGLFDAYLNSLQSEIIAKANTYKETRKLLRQFNRPGNYIDNGAAKENLTLFRESLAPSLRNQAKDIIAVFEKYSQKIEKDLAGEENDLQKMFLDQWKAMIQEQLVNYVDFFTREEKMIQAYDELIVFYYSRSKIYKIDEDNNKFIFRSDDDKIKETMLLERIKELQAQN